jgi:hypothetical protein
MKIEEIVLGILILIAVASYGSIAALTLLG